jgi:hypothetical protein
VLAQHSLELARPVVTGGVLGLLPGNPADQRGDGALKTCRRNPLSRPLKAPLLELRGTDQGPVARLLSSTWT